MRIASLKKQQARINQLIALSLFLIIGISANAKDLTNRLGIGYSNQFGADLPGISARYYPNPELGISAQLGVNTEEDNSRFGFMARVHRIIFPEENMNFYMGAGAGILSIEQNGDNSSGFELQGFFGAEFFLYGLNSLGFVMEAGVGVTSISSEVRFRTTGDHPMRAGIFFYF